jgi:tetratricopeptide (TPR) repeat protein
VAAYKLQNYERAESAFEEVARTPTMAALAHYNLGLVALRRGEERKAAAWFRRAHLEAADEKLRALASEQLVALTAEPTATWSGYAAAQTGYDDNVALISDSNVLGISGAEDVFVALQAAGAATLGERWLFDAGALVQDYQDLDSFDQLYLEGGARYQMTLGAWDSAAFVRLAYVSLNDEGVEQARMVGLQGRRRLSDPLHFAAEYRFEKIDGMNDFEGVGGDRHEIDARLTWQTTGWRADGGIRVESSDHDDSSLSARRTRVYSSVERAFTPLWSGGLEASFRQTRYRNEEQGTDRQTEFSLVAKRTFGRQWQWVTRYSRTDNDSDLADFDYERNLFSTAVEASF